jgi:hypothetical protein
MLEAIKYSEGEPLGNGRAVEIRALRPDDRAALIAAMDRSSTQSLYRRFFSPKRGFTEAEIAYFLNVDFVNHVVLVAVLEEGGSPLIVGGSRYIVVGPGTRAGIRRRRSVPGTRHRRSADAPTRQVCPWGRAQRTNRGGVGGQYLDAKIFGKSGMNLDATREGGIVHVTLQLS